MKPKHCKYCLSFAAHENKKNLTEAQKKHDDWCCSKGQKAVKSIAYCKIHNLKRTA